jgi:hypothetical protein
MVNEFYGRQSRIVMRATLPLRLDAERIRKDRNSKERNMREENKREVE